MRASRIVNLLLLLQARGGLTATELARELEVSVRTVYRDVDALSEAGVPIYAERGPGGGVRLVDGYRTRLTGLTTEEAEAVFLAGLPGPAAELGLGTVMTAARLKILAALPPELRTRASRITERFHLDAPGWFRRADEVPWLEALASAVWENRAVTVRYQRGERVEERALEPLGLVLKGGLWYLVALSKGEPRTFRVSRVVHVRTGAERFDRPDGFELAAFWAASTASYERSRPRTEVTVLVAPDQLWRLEDVVGASAIEPAIPGSRPERDGRLRLRVAMDADWVMGDLLRVGDAVEVVRPVEVRRRLLAVARAVVERHESAPASGQGASRQPDITDPPVPVAPGRRGPASDGQ